MKQAVLFIHGAGSEAYEEDSKLVASLRAALGDGYDVRYPAMPNAGHPDYEPWKAAIAEELARLNGRVILVGHSFGGSVLAKYLSEAQIDQPIAGLFLLATPFWNGADEDWQYDGFALREGFGAALSGIPQLGLYHCRDDAIVPVAHLGMYAARLPHAASTIIEPGGHQFNNDLSDVARDMQKGTSHDR